MQLELVAELIRRFAVKDYTMSRATIETMIAVEKNKKSSHAYDLLRRAYNYWGTDNKQFMELPYEIKGYSYNQKPQKYLNDIFLKPEVLKCIKSIINEFAQIEKIHEAGLQLRNKILLAGTIGNGKTSLAEALNNELKLIFIKINIAKLMNSGLGDLPRNVDTAFSSIDKCPKCLLFLDEVDSIATQRYEQESSDCSAEMARAVNILLQRIDMLPDSVLLVCATNFPDKLDTALLRRFKIKLWIGNPCDTEIQKFIDCYQNKYNVDFGFIDVKKLSGLPYSRIEDFCQNMHRNIVLGTNQVVPENVWIGRRNK